MEDLKERASLLKDAEYWVSNALEGDKGTAYLFAIEWIASTKREQELTDQNTKLVEALKYYAKCRDDNRSSWSVVGTPGTYNLNVALSKANAILKELNKD